MISEEKHKDCGESADKPGAIAVAPSSSLVQRGLHTEESLPDAQSNELDAKNGEAIVNNDRTLVAAATVSSGFTPDDDKRKREAVELIHQDSVIRHQDAKYTQAVPTQADTSKPNERRVSQDCSNGERSPMDTRNHREPRQFRGSGASVQQVNGSSHLVQRKWQMASRSPSCLSRSYDQAPDQHQTQGPSETNRFVAERNGVENLRPNGYVGQSASALASTSRYDEETAEVSNGKRTIESEVKEVVSVSTMSFDKELTDSLASSNVLQSESKQDGKTVGLSDGFLADAQLVDMQAEKDKLKAEAIKDIQESAVLASVVSQDEIVPSSSFFKRRAMYVAIAVGVAILTALGIILSKKDHDGDSIPLILETVTISPTLAPTMTIDPAIAVLLHYLNEVTWSQQQIRYYVGVFGESPTVEPSVEESAFHWTIGSIGDAKMVTTDSFLQRYVLACLGLLNSKLDDSMWLNSTSHECNWSGVTCDEDNATVVGIQLNDKSLTTLPDDFGLLTNLRVLDLESNELRGMLPLSFALMTSLEKLSIQNNRFGGISPWSLFANMTKLEEIHMGENYFSGSFPDDIYKWWPSLRVFSLWDNPIEGTIPEELGLAWPNVTYVDFDSTSLTGTLPSSLGKWTNLEIFYAFDTKLFGKLPESIGQWTNLQHFSVGKSWLSGTLPQTIASWTRLEVFSIPRNRFSGSLPKSIASSWTNVIFLDLSSNYFNGTIPADVSNFWTSIEIAYFENNFFTGVMPMCLQDRMFSILASDCAVLNCTCCTSCCSTAWNGIPAYELCEEEAQERRPLFESP